MSITVKKEVCSVCDKTVYPTEQLKADDKVYHKGCFRCEYCQLTIKLGSFASMDGRLFCKPHFKQLFNSKGNYSEGFGKLKPQQEFEAKRKGDNDDPNPKIDTIPTATEEKQIIKEEEVEIKQEHKVDEEVIETTQRTEINVTEVDTPQENHEHIHSNNHHVEDATTEPIVEVKEESRSTSVDSTPSVTVSVSVSHNETNTNSPDNKTKRLTPVGSPKIAISQSKCCVCNKTVYDKERVREDNSQGETFIFHKACFRCKVCNNVLGVGNFAALNNEFYCKPHFKQLFASKGNYSEGFGLLKPQQEHDLKKAEQKN